MSHGQKKFSLIAWALFLLGSFALQALAQTDRADRHRVPAEFMSYLGADWLERAERVEQEEPERVLDMMNLNPGDVVADVGCGSGYYARRMAQRVAPGGRVFCEDIQPEMLEIMRERVREEGLTNVEAILGTPTDPKLPAGEVDWIIIADVYHEMSDPEPMLAGIRRALAPTGRVALLEYRLEDGSGDQIKADHVMSVRQVVLEWQAAGFELEALHEFLPSQHLFFFRVAGGQRQDSILGDYDLFEALDAGLVEVEAWGADDQNVSLDSRQSMLVSFVFEAWREGDLQVYVVVNEEEGSRLPIDIPPIREEGASLTWFERVFGDGPLVVSLLILACTGLGFGMAMLWLREEDESEEDWEEDEEEEEDWPEPPDEFPDEIPPPLPPGIGDVDEEEE